MLDTKGIKFEEEDYRICSEKEKKTQKIDDKLESLSRALEEENQDRIN